MLTGITYDKNGTIVTNDGSSWITGTGRVGATTTTGNSSVMTSSDNTHPTQIGHDYLAEKIAYEIIKLFETDLAT
jgi:hypothetical protein